MEQQDYLKRQIDQIGLVLGRMLSDLLGLKSKGKLNNGIEIASQIFKSELDIDINELMDIPANDFIKILTTKKKYTNENLDKLAEIFLLIAEHGENTEWNKKLYEKCLTIHEYLEENDTIFSLERKSKIYKLKKLIKY